MSAPQVRDAATRVRAYLDADAIRKTDVITVARNADGSLALDFTEWAIILDAADLRALLAALDAQAADLDEYDGILARCGELLTGVANALNGPPPPMTAWSHHDLPEKARAQAADLAAAREEVAGLRGRVEAALADEPLIVGSIRRDVILTPAGRGGTLHHAPATPRRGGAGCPGDALPRWADRLRAALAEPVTGGEGA